MEVAIPHNLGREEVRNRLRTRSHTLADGIPGGMARSIPPGRARTA